MYIHCTLTDTNVHEHVHNICICIHRKIRYHDEASRGETLNLDVRITTQIQQY